MGCVLWMVYMKEKIGRPMELEDFDYKKWQAVGHVGIHGLLVTWRTTPEKDKQLLRDAAPPIASDAMKSTTLHEFGALMCIEWLLFVRLTSLISCRLLA